MEAGDRVWSYHGHLVVTVRSLANTELSSQVHREIVRRQFLSVHVGYHWDLERYNDDDGFTGTFYVGKLEADKWRWKKLSSKNVDMRYEHQSCELIGEDKLVVIGGNYYRNNVDIFDLKNNNWSKVLLNNFSFHP